MTHVCASMRHLCEAGLKQACSQAELETSRVEIDTLKGRLGESDVMRMELEEASGVIQSLNDKLRAAEQEAWESKLSRAEGDALHAEREKELEAVKGMNANLVGEVRERYEFAEKIRDNWRVIKATVETFQCGEVAPRGFQRLCCSLSTHVPVCQVGQDYVAHERH